MSKPTATRVTQFCALVKVVAASIEDLAELVQCESDACIAGVPLLKSELLGIAKTLRGVTDEYETSQGIILPTRGQEAYYVATRPTQLTLDGGSPTVHPGREPNADN